MAHCHPTHVCSPACGWGRHGSLGVRRCKCSFCAASIGIKGARTPCMNFHVLCRCHQHPETCRAVCIQRIPLTCSSADSGHTSGTLLDIFLPLFIHMRFCCHFQYVLLYSLYHAQGGQLQFWRHPGAYVSKTGPALDTALLSRTKTASNCSQPLQNLKLLCTLTRLMSVITAVY